MLGEPSKSNFGQYLNLVSKKNHQFCMILQYFSDYFYFDIIGSRRNQFLVMSHTSITYFQKKRTAFEIEKIGVSFGFLI